MGRYERVLKAIREEDLALYIIAFVLPFVACPIVAFILFLYVVVTGG